MTKPLFVLSPCGTSLLTNGADGGLRTILTRHANCRREEDVPVEDRIAIRSRIAAVKSDLAKAGPAEVRHMSAELNAIVSLYGGKSGGHQDFHQLLCTDTWLGEVTAGLVAGWLRQQGINTDVYRQPDLRTNDLTAFQFALADLVKWCAETIAGYRSGYHVIFNLTGGFKAVQGFLQTLATLYADETVYLFESSEKLLRIPRLPLKMDKLDTVRDNLTAFRRLSLGLPVADQVGIPETLILRLDGQSALSAWGEMVWDQSRQEIYCEALQTPPSDTIILSEPFRRDVGALSPQQLGWINERLDDLAVLLENRDEGNKHNRRRLDLKKFRGDPPPPSTHEFDAWAVSGAKRVFCHYDGKKIVLDRLLEGRH